MIHLSLADLGSVREPRAVGSEPLGECALWRASDPQPFIWFRRRKGVPPGSCVSFAHGRSAP